ncbi:MAG: hypothetical protein SFY66_12340 [Oculatellaceae cyanobacterium bins.114]|nr:hypothetical protein [Oculatellaceae cyanobacterium bins.114]
MLDWQLLTQQMDHRCHWRQDDPYQHSAEQRSIPGDDQPSRDSVLLGLFSFISWHVISGVHWFYSMPPQLMSQSVSCAHSRDLDRVRWR